MPINPALVAANPTNSIMYSNSGHQLYQNHNLSNQPVQNNNSAINNLKQNPTGGALEAFLQQQQFLQLQKIGKDNMQGHVKQQ